MFVDILASIASLSLAFSGSWELTSMIVITGPITFVITVLIRRKAVVATRMQDRERSRASKYAIASVTSIDLVKAFNAVDHETWQYTTAIRRAGHQYLVQARMYALLQSYLKFWTDGMFVLGFYFAAILVRGGMSAESVVRTFYAALAAIGVAGHIAQRWAGLERGISASKELSLITREMEGGREVNRMVGGHRPTECLGEIQINQVSLLAGDSVLFVLRPTIRY